MDNLPIAFNEEQQKIRKRWLFWAIKFTFALTLLFSLILAALSFLSEEGAQWSLFVFACVGLIIGSLYLYILYRCAYVKPGTKFLLFALIAGGISIASIIFNFFTQPIEDGMDLGFRVTDLIFESWIFYLNFLMRKINLSVKNQVKKENEI